MVPDAAVRTSTNASESRHPGSSSLRLLGGHGQSAGSPGRGRPETYSGSMNTIHLTDPELEMARHALQAYLQAFGHREADTVEAIKRVIAKLNAAHPQDEEPQTLRR